MAPTQTPLARIISEVVRRAKAGSVFSLFVDFDGTLVPIERDPSVPRVDSDVRALLLRLAHNSCCITTILSGRELEDLHRRIQVDGLIYAGNHGLEIRGRNIQFLEPGAAAMRARLEQLSLDLVSELQGTPGTFVEYKGLSTSVHFRQVKSSDLARMEASIRDCMARSGSGFRVRSGKEILEIVPRTSWNKGAAACWINRQVGRQQYFSIYFGDDRTDEDAFSALPEAITVRIGEPAVTGAKYQLPDPGAVHEFLAWIADYDTSRASDS